LPQEIFAVLHDGNALFSVSNAWPQWSALILSNLATIRHGGDGGEKFHSVISSSKTEMNITSRQLKAFLLLGQGGILWHAVAPAQRSARGPADSTLQHRR
jgi:hypothetical protein